MTNESGSNGSGRAGVATGSADAQDQVSSTTARRKRNASAGTRASTHGENSIGWVAMPSGPEAGATHGREGVRPESAAADGAAGARSGTSVSTRQAEKEVKARERIVPPQVRDHFLQVGKEYFFRDGARAFTDRGRKLSTPSENTQVIRDLVAIAHARGWQAVKVSGSERFRQQAWTTAREAGLIVTGYRASAVEEARLAQRLAGDQQPPSRQRPQSQSQSDARSEHAESSMARQAQSRERRQESVHGVREPRPAPQEAPRQHSGRLVEHGIAPYQHDPHEPMSYFVKLETDRGVREVWGVDLERAFRESLSRPQTGDEVILRAVKREAVTVRSRRESDEGPLDREVDLRLDFVAT